MPTPITHQQSAAFMAWLTFAISLFLFSHLAFGQKKPKNDHILINDTVHVEGKLLELPSGKFSSFTFRSIHESDFRVYSTTEVAEFGYKGRLFLRKGLPKSNEIVYLEKLQTSNREIDLLRINGNPEVYFVEQVQSGQIFELGESFQEILRQVNTNPLIDPLIPLTKLTENSLTYLLNSGQTVSKKTTLSKNLYLTIFLGFGRSEVQYLIPNIETSVSQPAFSFSGGVGAEAFINFKRTISVNFMPHLMGFNSSSYHVVTLEQSKKYETDIGLTWLGVQLPVSGKFYLDLKPQKLRAYLETGYTFGITVFQNSAQYGAMVTEETVVINREKITLPDHYRGALFGIGADFVLTNQQIVNVGVRLIPQKAKNESYSIDSMVFSVGYKF